MSDPRSPSGPFGLVEFLSWDHDWNRHHNGGDRLARVVSLLKESGATFVRFDFLWSDIEPAEGRFEFDRCDRIVDLLSHDQIKALGVLAYTPAWHRSDWRAAPEARLYTRFVRAVIRRYKDRIRHWEIWHEPDNAAFWRPQDHMASYTRLLKQVHAGMKEEDPTCLVHLGGLSKALPGSLIEIYDEGGKDFFDVLQFHAFSNPRSEHALRGLESLYEEVRRIMVSYGDPGKEIWLTQISCPGMRNPKSAPQWWLGPNLSEKQQADWLTKVMSAAIQWPGVGAMIWSFLRDTDRHFQSGVDSFGLVRQDFSKKPAFYAFQKLVHDSRFKPAAARWATQ